MFIFHVLSSVLCHLVSVFEVLLIPKLCMVVWPLEGMAFGHKVELHCQLQLLASVIFCLPLLFPFCIVKALGTYCGSLKMAFDSVCKSWVMCVPVEVVGSLGSTSVRGSVWPGLSLSVSSLTCS